LHRLLVIVLFVIILVVVALALIVVGLADRDRVITRAGQAIDHGRERLHEAMYHQGHNGGMRRFWPG
jgi:hypothetical protein